MNFVTLAWYLRLGFVISDFFAGRLREARPVVFLVLEFPKCSGRAAPTRLFKSEVCTEKVVVLPQSSPVLFIAQFFQQRKGVGECIKTYNRKSGAHTLEGGRIVDLTMEFMHGRVFF